MSTAAAAEFNFTDALGQLKAQVTPCMFFAGLISFMVIRDVISAPEKQSPYGRYTNARAAPPSGNWRADTLRLDYPIPARLGWFLMESPNLITGGSILAYALKTGAGGPLGRLMIALFTVHFVIRTLVFSLLLRGSKPMPMSSLLIGGAFTMINGTVQTYHHLFELPATGLNAADASPLASSARVQLGVALFVVGFFVNQLSDYQLRMLRKNDEDTGYYLPRGWFFEYLSAPNLVAEIAEWLGYALVANTFVAWCFAASSGVFLTARATSHHKWNQNKFADEYPPERKALIPFVY